MNNRTKLCSFLSFLAFVICFSYSNAVAEEELDPGFYPALSVGYATTDNVFMSDGNEQSDDALVIAPSLLYKMLFGKHSLDFNYIGEFTSFDTYSTEDYNDNRADAELLLDLTRRLDVTLDAGYMWSHENRGVAGSRGGTPRELDTWEQGSAEAKVTYGRRTSTAQIEVSGSFLDRKYTNNGQEERDRERAGGTIALYYNISSKTSLLIEGTYVTVDYVNDASINLDSTETFTLAGVRWEATAKTTGEIKLGYHTKDMDEEYLEDFEGGSYFVSLLWEPKPYSQITLEASRRTDEVPYDESVAVNPSYYVRDTVSVYWKHSFTDNFISYADVAIHKVEYGGIDQTEDYFNTWFELEYHLRDWLRLGAKYQYNSRDSSAAGLDYVANTFLLKVTLVNED